MDKVKIILIAAVTGIGVQYAFSIYWTMVGISVIMFVECLYFLLSSPEGGFTRKGAEDMIEQSRWSAATHVVCAIAMLIYAELTDKLGHAGFIEYWDNGDLPPKEVVIPQRIWQYLMYIVVFRIVMQFIFETRIRRRLEKRK